MQGGRGDPAGSVTRKLRTGAYSGGRATDGCASAPLPRRHPRGCSVSVVLQNGSWRCSEMQPEYDLGIGNLSSHCTPSCCVCRQSDPGGPVLSALSPHPVIEGVLWGWLRAAPLSCLGVYSEAQGLRIRLATGLPLEGLLTEHALGFCPSLWQAHLSPEPRLRYFLWLREPSEFPQGALAEVGREDLRASLIRGGDLNWQPAQCPRLETLWTEGAW